MAIGFIGLGNLGTAITTRLSQLGETLVVYNRNIEKIKDLGYEIVSSPKEILQKCDVIFLCLFDSEAVKQILTGDNGLLCEELKGKTIIDLTTNHYEEVLEFHKLVNDFGANYLENPVFGSVAPALKGELTVVSSGKIEVLEAMKPILEKIAKEIGIAANRSGQWRYRMGDYRVTCEIIDEEVVVLALTLGRRKDI